MSDGNKTWDILSGLNVQAYLPDGRKSPKAKTRLKTTTTVTPSTPHIYVLIIKEIIKKN